MIRRSRLGLTVAKLCAHFTGRRVMVERGPLVGTDGIVVELKKKMPIAASVSSL